MIVHPHEDPLVLAGAGTVALEIEEGMQFFVRGPDGEPFPVWVAEVKGDSAEAAILRDMCLGSRLIEGGGCGFNPKAPRYTVYPAGSNSPGALHFGVDLAKPSDYIRRVTFNVARVASVSGGALNLEQPLPGGAPPSNSFVQKVVGFTDREGGSFFP